MTKIRGEYWIKEDGPQAWSREDPNLDAASKVASNYARKLETAFYREQQQNRAKSKGTEGFGLA